MAWRDLCCPVCGSDRVLLTCRAKVRLEVDEIREDGGFTVNYDEVFDLRGFSIKCMRCPASRYRDWGQGDEPTKDMMREWSVKAED